VANNATRRMYAFWIRTRRGERPMWRFEWARENWGIEQAGAVEPTATSIPYPI